jgi:isopentenyl-diphosphate delta-isomerase
MTMRSRVEQVVLVDEQDREIGVEDKLAAHRNGGALHRAFSIFIFNRRGEMLLQKRAATKYHFRSIWGNSCCGHPRPGEELVSAARRRLREELGIDTELKKAGVFTYTAEDPESGLTEKEIDHVLVGWFDGIPQPHPDEIDEIRWVSPADLEQDLARTSDGYAPWLPVALAHVSSLQKLGLLDRLQDETASDTAHDSDSDKGIRFRG